MGNLVTPRTQLASNVAPSIAPLEASIDQIQTGKDAIGRSVLELHLKHLPNTEFLSVNPFDPTNEKILKFVFIQKDRDGWKRDGEKFNGDPLAVSWEIKYRKDKMGDVRLLEIVDMAPHMKQQAKQPAGTFDKAIERAAERDMEEDLSRLNTFFGKLWVNRGIKDFARQRTILKEALGSEDLTFREQLKAMSASVIIDKMTDYVSNNEPVPDLPDDPKEIQQAIDLIFSGTELAVLYQDARTKIQHEVITKMYGSINLDESSKVKDFDRGLLLANIKAAAEEAIKEDKARRNHEPVVEQVNDFDILEKLRTADLTPSPDVEPKNDLDIALDRLPNGEPNPDTKPKTEINDKPLSGGKDSPEIKEPPKETEVSKNGASEAISEKPNITREEWTKFEADQKANLNLERRDILQALSLNPEIGKYSEYTGTLEQAAQDVIGLCNQRTHVHAAKIELEQAGIPIDEVIRWIADAGDPPKASDPLSIAQWTDPLRKKAIAYNANKPEPQTAIVPVEPKQITVPTLPMRAIKLPTPDELGMMQTFAKSVASSKLYKDVDTFDKALVILWKGFELGVSFGAALDGIYIINGRPWPGAMILKAVVDASGKAERFDILNDGVKCRVVVKRKDRTSTNEYSYSLDEARTAGLMNKDTWKNHGKRMMTHRAVRQAVMSEFPDIAAGIGMDFNGEEDEAA